MGKGVSKMRLKDFIGCFIFCACLVLPCFAVNAAGVTNYSSFISADYWVKITRQESRLYLMPQELPLTIKELQINRLGL